MKTKWFCPASLHNIFLYIRYAAVLKFISAVCIKQPNTYAFQKSLQMQTKHLYFSDLSAMIELISLFGGTK